MKILHYSLGFPPYRSGGLVQFCIDLLKQQMKEGHETAMLWPGQLGVLNHQTQINDCGKVDNIHSFEIKNPLPVSYDEGILDIDRFMANGDIAVYNRLLLEWSPDIIHIHTFMGLHRAFLEAAKARGIKMVFSAHDFFPICPKVTLFRNNQICTCPHDYSQCPLCNTTALSRWKRWILQHPFYRKTKNCNFVQVLRKRHRNAYLSGEISKKRNRSFKIKNTSADYARLRSHYKSFLALVDCVHYNSTLTRDIYQLHMGAFVSRIISITHFGVKDNRNYKAFKNEIRFTYLGPQSAAKGFFLLRKALDRLWLDRQNFKLNIYFTPTNPSPYLCVSGRYQYDQMGEIFRNTDVLVAPSIGNETFGYTVLEALSYGIPVIISGNVGARDIIPQGAGIIIDDISEDRLYDVVSQISPEQLREMNQVICEKFTVPTMALMSRQIRHLCYEGGT